MTPFLLLRDCIDCCVLINCPAPANESVERNLGMMATEGDFDTSVSLGEEEDESGRPQTRCTEPMHACEVSLV